MAQLAVEVERRFGNGVAPAKDLVAAAIRRFHSTGRAESFRDIKLVCYGVSTEILPDHILLFRNRERIGRLLGIVEGLRSERRKYRRCFQALMTAYFECRPAVSQEEVHRSWHEIRNFLRTGISSIGHEPMPDWAKAIFEHQNLFEDDPCEPYAKEVLNGNLAPIRAAFSLIGVPKNSWVQTDVFMAAICASCGYDDYQFRRYLDVLLTILKDNPGIALQGLKRILDRYAVMQLHPEHPALRAIATELLGNPLLASNAPRWEGVSQEARCMVSNWIKLKLIEQFFELLSHDGSTDKRRVKYWAEYVTVIENVWFALGSNARRSLNPDFKKLRLLMGDQALNLEGATSDNNAFVMKIGDLLIVEFGRTGNAAYLFEAKNPPFRLDGSVHLRDDLKHRRNLGSMDHRDGNESWEDKFRRAISEHTPLLRGRPDRQHNSDIAAARPNSENTKDSPNGVGGVFAPNNFEHVFRAFCAERGLRFSDRRAFGGKLVVYASGDNPKISGTLGQWGFRFDRQSTTWIKE
nr:EH signature domain-containing protein [Nitrospira moscoviensis]